MLDTKHGSNLPPSAKAVRLLRELKSAGDPIKLTINGTMELFVRDDKSLEMLEALADRLGCIEELRAANEELDEGKGMTLEQVKDALLRSQ
jgi:hypothetical protein